MRFSHLLLFSIFASTLSHADEPDGASLFTVNCSACHSLDQSVVGPSLVEIRSLYLNKPDDFVKWAVAPQKKRPNTVDMPSMVHVGEPGLRAIYKHVMAVAEGAQAKKAEDGDAFAASPTQALRPLVQRIFLPDAGPAAIAVALDQNTSLCWDASNCRFRYAWTGGFIDGFPYWRGNGNGLADIKGTRRYTEPESIFPHLTPSFKGYRLTAGLPVFHYTSGPQTIHETFQPLANGTGFTRSFTLSPAPTENLVLTFPADQPVKTTSDVGSWNNNTLTLTPAQAQNFTLTHLFQ
jgi:cytochrome c551/c552